MSRVWMQGVCAAVFGTLAGCGVSDIPTPDGLPFNFHAVEAGAFFRSGQPGGDQLARAAAAHGIKTVLNMRGDNTGKDWYDDEAAACDALGLRLVNVRTSARSLFPPEELSLLVETLETAEYPLLVHCDTGSDRTGAAAAIYRILRGEDRSAAMSELSPVYFHYRAVRPCMDTLAEIFEPGAEWQAWYAANVEQIACTP